MAFRSSAHSYASVPDTIIPIPSNPTFADGSTSAAAATASAATWETLRKQARQLENEIESKLVQYSKLGSTAASSGMGVGLGKAGPNSAGMSSPGANGVELELEHLLAKLTNVVNYMAQSLENIPSTVPTNPSMMHMLQRHRDILYDYSKEFKKTKANIAAARDHADLLSSVRQDIRSGLGSNNQDYLLAERGRIDDTHRMADDVLEAAYATRAEMNDQRGILYGSKGRMGGVLARFPLVNDLISRINRRKKRDSLIMAGVISGCLCLIMWYWLSRF